MFSADAVWAIAGAPLASPKITAAAESGIKRMIEISFASGAEIRRRWAREGPSCRRLAKILIKIRSVRCCGIDLSQWARAPGADVC
jgi:hypothetical protein